MDNIRQLDDRPGATRRLHIEPGQREEPDAARRPATPLGKSLGRLAILALTHNLAFGSRLSRLVEAQNLQISLFWSVEAMASVSLPGFDLAVIDAELWPLVERRILNKPAGRQVLAVALVNFAADATAASKPPSIAGAEAVSTPSGIPILNLPAGASPSEILERLGKLAHHHEAHERREPEPLPPSPQADLEVAIRQDTANE